MKSPIGFVLVTHANPGQTLLLCRRLSTMFGDPPISIHHDFSQAQFDKAEFPSNVRFVDPWVRTDWGGFSVVTAQLAALGLLYETSDPDWVTLLSSSDYPIQTADQIVGELATTEFDGFVDSRQIREYPGPFIAGPLGEFPFRQPRYHQVAYNRYIATPLMSRRMARRLRTPVEKWCLRSSWLSTRLTPFKNDVHCYGGDAWFTVNRRVAHLLLDPTPFRESLLRHYRARPNPEESIYQTLLGNTPGVKISPDNRRYTDWKGCYAHPRTLGREDFPRLLASTDHFARKFPFDADLMADLDRAVEAHSAKVGTKAPR